MGKRLILLVLVAILLWPTAALGEGVNLKDSERIESFSSRIAILPEGGIEVTETIILLNHGEKIRWGLERLLPRWYETGTGLEQASGYEIVEVLVDGAQSEYSLTDTEAGLAVTVGDPAITLPPGRYVYILSYRCSRLVQFHDFGESLNWNVTGLWPVPIEQASVSLEFARAPRPGFNDWTATVGAPAESGQDWVSTLEERDWLTLETTRPLAAGEAMNIQASWPRGYSYPPLSGERILSLDTRATMNIERELTVQEQVILSNDGSWTQGFAWDFAGLYRDGDGTRRISKLEITQVRLNGRDISWVLEDIPAGQRLLVGSTQDQLPLGNSVLSFSYNLDRQVLTGEEIEELRWLLPGFSIAQDIEQARFTLELPIELRARLLMAAYTRLNGDTGSDVFHYIDNNGRIVFASTRPLEAGESLVSSVAWPVGSLPPITWQERFFWLLRDNASAVAALAILALLLFWYILVWSKRGRRPLGKVTPVASPPDKLSPALLRYLRSGVYDNRTFTAAVLSLAVKGCLMIVEEEGKYALVSSGISPYLPVDEEALLKTLFAKRMAVFPAKHRSLVKAARKTHKQELAKQVKGTLLSYNRGWFYTAAGLSLLGGALSGLLLPVSWPVVAGLGGFILWACLLAVVASRTWSMTSGLVDDRGRGAVALALLAEIVLVFAVSYPWANWLAGKHDWLTIAAVLGIVGINALFSRLLVAPTPQGREVMEQAQGFRAWLVSDEDGRPGGAARFEKFLPYAVALDTSSHWGRRFGVPKRKGSFSPRWYQGSRWHTINAETLAASLSMLPRSAHDRK